MDEGVNAEAAREMREADTWVVPTFNYQLRTAKPVMLYWLQRASYAAFGVSEWSARLPSVLAGWLAVLLTYELARRMFGRATGLLAGVVLASVVQFCMLAHAATPDATLLLFTMPDVPRVLGRARGRFAPVVGADGGGVRAGGADQGAGRRRAAGAGGPPVLRVEPRTRAAARPPDLWARRWCSCWWPGRGTGWWRARRAGSG